MPNISTKIAQILLDRGAVKISLDPPFTWTSGILAPVYCDNRILPSFPTDRETIVDGFVQLIRDKNLDPDAIGGTATAGIPWAAFVAQKMNLPMFYVRPKPKAHGAGKQIEGFLKKGAKIVMIEDLFSTGGSSIKAAEACQRETEAEVLGIFSIVTYGMDSAEINFKNSGFVHGSLTTFPDILELLQGKGDFSKTDVAQILEFTKDSENWGASL